ncbi:MAG TPA: hypothetical protein VK974_01200 [Methylophilaceae bacterium]|nr:hypothetical protein [Methylophilaceae bacterium]
MASFDDLSKVFDKDTSPKEISASTHLESLIQGTGVRISNPLKIHYPAGMHNLIAEFVAEVQDISVNILMIYYEHGEIHLEFDMYRQRGEVKVWQSLHTLKLDSQRVCGVCGSQTNRKIFAGKLQAICTECIRKKEQNGETGTWLDRY